MTLKELKSYALARCGGDEKTAEMVTDELPIGARDEYLTDLISENYDELVIKSVESGQCVEIKKLADHIYLVKDGSEEDIVHIADNGRITFYKKLMKYENLREYNSIW